MKPPIIAAQNSPSTPTPQAPPSPNAARLIGKKAALARICTSVLVGDTENIMTVIVRRAHRRQYVHVHEVATKKSLLSRWAGARLKSERNGKQTTEGASNVAHRKQDGQHCPHVAAHRGGIRDGAAIRLPRDLIPMCINVGNKLPTPPCFLVEESCRVSF